MKKLVLVGAILFFTSTCFAETRIVKIAENNCEVQEVYYKDKAGKEEVIISKESYGTDRLEREKANAQLNLDAIDAMTAEEYKNKARKAFTDHKAKLEEVQKVMDKDK